MQRIAATIEGTCQSVASVLSSMDLDDVDPEEVESRLADFNLEECPGCGWWMEAGELINGDGDVVGCADCREADDE